MYSNNELIYFIEIPNRGSSDDNPPVKKSLDLGPLLKDPELIINSPSFYSTQS